MQRNLKIIDSIGWFFFTIILLIVFASCEKVIDINLNKTNPRYVIEGNMSDNLGDCKILVTQTINFSDPSVFKGVQNAIVSISEDDKEPVKLRQTSAGVYESDFLRSKPSHSYTLSVTIGSQKFTSTVKVPEKVPLDSLYIIDFNSFGTMRKFVNVVFKDPEGVGNAYRFIQYKNRIQNPNIFILNDLYSDGRMINTFLAFFNNSDNLRLDKGDTVKVEMQGIDPSVYKFLFSLIQSSTGGNGNVAPGNPVSNITGGAIGYFNAYVKETKMVIVP